VSHPAFLSVTLLTPEKVVLEGYSATALLLPGEDGELGVFPQHTPLLVSLNRGVVTVHAETETLRYLVSDGFADILPDHVTLLVAEIHPLGYPLASLGASPGGLTSD
jgi:F-type H+-transporting ATPase subunit epsilon